MSLRKAINEKCKECIYDEYALGNWRQQTGACTSPNCPLFPHRPRSTGSPINVANSVQKTAKLAPESTLKILP